MRNRIIKPSTLAFFREGRRTPGYTFFDWLHGYIYGRWPYLYIGLGTGEHRLTPVIAPLVSFLCRLLPPRAETNSRQAGDPSKGEALAVNFADTYHGKVMPVEAATRLVNIHEEIRITNLEKVIPYTKARDIIMQNPQHIVVLECPCRLSRPSPCLPLDVCLIVGDPFASFVEEHHPRRSRRISSHEAEEIIRAEHQRGHVQHAFFKDAMLGRFYAICNCCECCCGAMQAQRNGTPMLASSGYVSRVDPELCIACGDCAAICPFEAATLGEFSAVVDEQACMGCGVCTSHCAQNAMTLELAPERGIPLEVGILANVVL